MFTEQFPGKLKIKIIVVKCRSKLFTFLLDQAYREVYK